MTDVFTGWSDEAIRGYLTMARETFLTGSLRPIYERRVAEAEHELQARAFKRRSQQPHTGSL